MKYVSNIPSLAFFLLLIAVPAFAQHNHHEAPWYKTTTIYDQNGNQVTSNYDSYSYVIPSNQNSRGTYYTNNNVRYYHDHDHGHGNTGRPTPVQFGGFSHMDDLAIRLEFIGSELCFDMHYNYQHNPDFNETYREALDLFHRAKAVHLESHHGHHAELAKLIAQMDPLFHHIEEDVTNWTRHNHRLVGQGDIKAKIEQMESLIHHLMYDAGVEASHDGHGHGDGGPVQAPRPDGIGIAPPPAP